MAKLKPCPFCGEQPTTENFSGEMWSNAFTIACTNPDCGVNVKIVCDKSIAIKEWNTRAGKPAEEKTAYWDINCDGYYPFCSRCGKEPPGREMSKYCPQCGSRMANRG